MRIYIARQGHPELIAQRLRLHESHETMPVQVVSMPFGPVAGLTPPAAARIDAAFGAGCPLAIEWKERHSVHAAAARFLAQRMRFRGEFGWIDIDPYQRIYHRVAALYPVPRLSDSIFDWKSDIDAEADERLRLQGLTNNDERLRDVAARLGRPHWRLARWCQHVDQVLAKLSLA